jgi:hypothetical protein
VVESVLEFNRKPCRAPGKLDQTIELAFVKSKRTVDVDELEVATVFCVVDRVARKALAAATTVAVFAPATVELELLDEELDDDELELLDEELDEDELDDEVEELEEEELLPSPPQAASIAHNTIPPTARIFFDFSIVLSMD